MTSPPRRPILSLKFKTPVADDGMPKPPVAPPTAPQAVPLTKTLPRSKKIEKTIMPPKAPVSKAVPAPKAPKAAKPAKAPKASPAPKVASTTKSGPAISPDIFRAAVKAAAAVIVNVIADPAWQDEALFERYKAAKDQATSTNRQQAKLVSTVATRRHAADIEQANVQNAAMRAAYAAALVALVAALNEAETGPVPEA